jgi:hypothetical protein
MCEVERLLRRTVMAPKTVIAPKSLVYKLKSKFCTFFLRLFLVFLIGKLFV